MKKLLVLAMAAMLSAPVVAGTVDGNKRVLCTTEELRDCVAGEACFSDLPAEYGAPTSLRIDFARKQVLGEQRNSKIRDLEKTKDQLLLQGREMGYGWTIAIQRSTGAMTLGLINREGAFVLFGQCAVI